MSAASSGRETEHRSTTSITARRAKFKLGQNRPLDTRAKIVEELRKRGRPNDQRAADALQWTIDVQKGRSE